MSRRTVLRRAESPTREIGFARVAWPVTVLALLLGLIATGCHTGEPKRETRPCADLEARASAECEKVALACSTVPQCLRALPQLVDPDAHFPSQSACGKKILARLDQTSVADVPSLLEAVSNDDDRTSLLAQGMFRRLDFDEVEAALAANPSAEATIALAAIATDATRSSALRTFQARPDGRDIVRRFVTKRGLVHQEAWRELAGIRNVEIQPEDVPRAALALRPEDDGSRICAIATAPRPPGEDEAVRRAFGRLALSARSKAGRECALHAASRWRHPPPANSHEAMVDPYGPRPKTTLSGVTCRHAPARAGDAWHFVRKGVVETVQAPRREDWRADTQSGSFGDWICFDHPRLRAIEIQGVVVSGFEGSSTLVAVRGDEAFPILDHPAIAVHAIPPGGVVAVASMIHGDDALIESLVVFTGRVGDKLTEHVGLPGERFEWSRMDADRTLLVATSTWSSKGDIRYLSAIGDSWQEPVDCW